MTTPTSPTNAQNKIPLEDGSGYLLLEDDSGYLLYEWWAIAPDSRTHIEPAEARTYTPHEA